ncbi:MAG: DHH family phosphoesterase [Evtepia sp.]
MDDRQAADLLSKQDHILILTHRRPDGDTIGSAAALVLALRHIGKTAYLFPNQEAHGLFTPYLEGVVAPPNFSPKYLVSVDIAAEALFPPDATHFCGKIDLCLDHHSSNEHFAKNSCLDATCAACGELIYRIVSLWDALSKPIALLLYMAIATDSGCFVYSNTSPTTHRIVADLMEYGFDHQWVNKRHFRTKSYKRLALESLIIQGLELHDNGKLAIASVTLEMMSSLSATEEDAEDISSFIGQLAGVSYAVTLREVSHDECKLSLRTDASLNASTVCMLLGGGGHPAAAGCTVYTPVAEAKAAILAAIHQVNSHA